MAQNTLKIVLLFSFPFLA